MRFLAKFRMATLVAFVPAAMTFATLPADAAQILFSGGVTGTDPLGGVYTAGPNAVTSGPNAFGFPTWGETYANNNNAYPTFHGGAATAFIFTYTGSAPNSINTSFDTGLTQIGNPEGQGWDTTYLSPTEVEFTAPTASEPHPAGLQLLSGDQFDVIVGFNNPIDPSTFSFTAGWVGNVVSAVPEPATWALFILGFGTVGCTLRSARRQRNAASAAMA
jgi:hypothetical protein